MTLAGTQNSLVAMNQGTRPARHDPKWGPKWGQIQGPDPQIWGPDPGFDASNALKLMVLKLNPITRAREGI